MNIFRIRSHEDIRPKEPSVLVLGYFDALHKGHRKLFEEAKVLAEKENLKIAVLTFPESPQLAFSRFSPELLNHINYPEKRYAKFAEYGVDDLYLTDFTSAFAKTSSDDFINDYIQALKAKAVVVGFDYKFGHNKTDSDYLKRNFSGQVVTVPEVQYQQEKISSTRVRQLIGQGDVAQVNQLLGYEFSTRGIVVHGDARGRTIGFPTANLAPIDRTYLPADGVYVSDVLVGEKRYRSMTSIGKNVTFGGTELRLEANIFDFDGDIYGETIEILWLDKIREMIKFNGIDDLVKQLETDKEFALNWGKA
ncbi:bifunctional riboflavin kinase/FAD synthetase [Streptococcus caviae]|uniref:bifunctional riboflavin kinase/FAD synthetase n=1 Tax=Streptococcus sp. 'caviae' TaxID=1915004 RepID=UPI00094B91ED|nr:bifunctional riboflavin kinase/FAD synthetase [Streptococcus sp. 'caviae']OLN82614.1 riboflavin biosynthesis protein RibF [Streptococcus sp. 'caviae']